MFELGSAGGGVGGVGVGVGVAGGVGEGNSNRPMFSTRLQNYISYTAFRIILWEKYLP